MNLTHRRLCCAWPPGGPRPDHATPPPSRTFEQVYRQLQANRPCDGIVSIHVSARLSGTYDAALMAPDAFGTAPSRSACSTRRRPAWAWG